MSLSDLEVLLIESATEIVDKEGFENFSSILTKFTNLSSYVTIFDNNMNYAPEDIYRIIRYLVNMAVTDKMVKDAKTKKIVILKAKNINSDDLEMILGKINDVIKEYDLNILLLPEEIDLMPADEFFMKLVNYMKNYEKLKEKIDNASKETIRNYIKKHKTGKKSD